MSKRKSSQSQSARSTMSFFRSQSSSPTTDLIHFYEGTGVDDRGRSLSDILQWNASRLESSHDYIQTVFPLPESSGVNWDAPVIDRKVFDAFRSRPDLRDKLRESFQKILWFYGFELEQGTLIVKVVKGHNYDKHSENWDSRFDHNHLRITRIIRCLRVLGLQKEALAFRSALEQNFSRVSPQSREYWRRAAERTLNIRPDLDVDDEHDISFGPNFLREFEQKLQNCEAEAKTKTKPKTEVEENNDFCSACGTGDGMLACCDGCVRSFHSTCANPPVVEVTNEAWLCDKCQATAESESPKEMRSMDEDVKKPKLDIAEVETAESNYEIAKTNNFGESEEIHTEAQPTKNGQEETTTVLDAAGTVHEAESTR